MVQGRVDGTHPHRIAGVLMIMIMLTGCSYSRQEPGLFGRDTPTPSPTGGSTTAATTPPTSLGTSTPRQTNPDLPVAGERTWTAADGSQLTFRIAVHTLRRIQGATVLDWSITPLPGSAIKYGDPVPQDVLLGPVGDPLSFRLIDTDVHAVFRPLRNEAGGCLCTSQGPLQVGVTRIQQLAFPRLPGREDVGRKVEVDVPSVALFTQVFAPPIGSVLQPDRSPDLSRPATPDGVIRWTEAFNYPKSSGQRMRIGIIAVTASAEATSVTWSLWSISAGDGIGRVGAPPVTDPADAAVRRAVASGVRLQLRAKAPSTGEDLLLPWRDGLARTPECLCTDLQGWAPGLTEARRSVTMVTNLPPMPADIGTVQVVLPGLSPVARIQVEAAATPPPVRLTTGSPERWASGTFRTPPQLISAWPTPLPNEGMLPYFIGSTEPLR